MVCNDQTGMKPAVMHGLEIDFVVMLLGVVISDLQILTFFPGHMKLADIDVRVSVNSSR